jgi:hypothetical protein
MSRSPNLLVTSLLFCGASMDRKRVFGIVLQTTITNNAEKIAFTEETFIECLYKAAIAESNDNVRLEVKIANSVY